MSSGKPNSQVWYNDYKAININSNYKIIEVARNNNFNSDDWTDAFNGVGLMPGDIICGRTSGDTGGHMAIYLGNADSYTRLNQYMNDYGVGTFSNRNIGGTVKGNWLVYATWEGGTSKINAYSNLFKSGTTVKCSKLVVYRFEKAEPNPTTYSLRLTKNGNLGGAQFAVVNKVSNASTTITTKSGSYTKVTGLGGNMDSTGEINVNSEGLDVYAIREWSAPDGYNNDWNFDIYLGVQKGKVDNKYQISKIKVSTNINYVKNTNTSDWKTVTGSSQIYYPDIKDHASGSLIVDYHGVGKNDAGEYNSLGVISLVFKDDINPPETNTYNVTLTKTDENGNIIPEGKFDVSYNYINPTQYFTYQNACEEKNNVTDADYLFTSTHPDDWWEYQLNNYHWGNTDKIYGGDIVVNSNNKIVNNGVIIANNFTNFGLQTAADRIAKGESINFTRVYKNEKIDLSPQVYFKDKEFIIEDSYNFKEQKIAGYEQDYNIYTIVVTKAYSIDSSVGTGKYKGYIKSVLVKCNGYDKIKRVYNQNGDFVAENSYNAGGVFPVDIDIKGVGRNVDEVNINIKLKNKKITGSYNLYIGKKSSDKYEARRINGQNKPEVQPEYDNIAGAVFKVEKWLNGESQSTTDYITSVDNYWNDGNFYPIKMTNTITDKIHITEVSPPKGYTAGKVRQIWIDVYKEEKDNEYVIQKVEYTFRDEKDEIVESNGTQADYWQYEKKYWSSFISTDYNTIIHRMDKNIFFMFFNDKQYSFNISKRDKNNNIIKSNMIEYDAEGNITSEKHPGNANFSVKMFTTINKTDKTINLSGNTEINPEIKTDNLTTADGQISLNNLGVTRYMLNKTFYYEITENTAPNGYNSVGSIIMGIKFDGTGNSSLESLYHVKKEGEGKYSIISTGTNVANSSNLTVNVGNDGISANANSTNNIINIDIQQPDREDSYYDLQLEKKMLLTTTN